MSFDIFNYSLTLNEIDRAASALYGRILTLTMRRMDIMSMSDSARTLMGGDNIRLTAAIIDDNNDMDALGEIKRKIHALIELPSQMKMQLFTIFQILGLGLGEFAERLPICYEGLLMEIPPKICDSADMSRDEKRIIAREIYKKYELLSLPKYYKWVAAESMI